MDTSVCSYVLAVVVGGVWVVLMVVSMVVGGCSFTRWQVGGFCGLFLRRCLVVGFVVRRLDLLCSNTVFAAGCL